MKMSDLRPANDFARSYGVKCVVYGEPGSGKTPIVNTAPRPVLCATEPGLLSMRGSTVPTFEAHTPEKINEFFDWLLSSAEAKNFDTIAFDSGSQHAEIELEVELRKNRDGRKAYGEMARHVMGKLRALYFLREKHIYLICKQQSIEDGGVIRKRPYFPGQELNVQVPHLYDEILHLSRVQIPGASLQLAFRTLGTFDITARDRTGRLAEFEPPNLTALFSKAMS
jgi:hypothetical protein